MLHGVQQMFDRTVERVPLVGIRLKTHGFSSTVSYRNQWWLVFKLCTGVLSRKIIYVKLLTALVTQNTLLIA